MKIIIEGRTDQNGEKLPPEVYENVTDLALIMCQFRPVGIEAGAARGEMRLLPLARARSIFGQYPRELVKEVQVVADELWDHLKELPNGNRT